MELINPDQAVGISVEEWKMYISSTPYWSADQDNRVVLVVRCRCGQTEWVVIRRSQSHTSGR